MNSDSYFRFIPLSSFPNVSLRKKFLLVSLFFLLLSSISFSQLSQTVNFPVSSLSLTTATAADGNIYTHISLSGLPALGETGLPQLPIKYVKLLIPQNSKVKNIVLSNIKKVSYYIDNKIFPQQTPQTTGINDNDAKFVSPNKSTYDSSDYYPSSIVKIVNESYFDGNNHIVTIAVYPVQYFPKENRIELNTDITFTLEFESSAITSIPRPQSRTQEGQEIYDNILKSMIDNPENINYQTKPSVMSKASSVSKVTTTLPFYKYVIITSNALKNSFTQFVNWKKKKGIDIGVVTVEDIYTYYPISTGDAISQIHDSAGSVRQYLHDGWYNSGGQQITYYALLADSLLANNQHSVPIRYGCGTNNTWQYITGYDQYGNPIIDPIYYKIPTDLYFSNLTSNWKKDGNAPYYGEIADTISCTPNIFVGRMFFASSIDVANWTAKEIQYEQNPFNGSYSNVTKDLWTIADEMQAGNQNTLVESYIPSLITHTTLQEVPSAYAATTTGPTGTDVISALNTGYGFYNIYNHGASIAYVVSDSLYNLRPRRGVARYSTDGSTNTLSLGGYSEFSSFDQITANNTSTIVYSTACDVAQSDDPTYRSIADVYTTLGNSGGTAFLGNTRVGYVDYSYLVHEAFVSALYSTTNPIYHLGQTEAVSKSTYTGSYDHFLALTHNLYGDPEMPVWTATPATFSSLTVTDAGNAITVSTGINGSTICVCSPDNGSSYYYSVTSSSYTFTTSVRPLYVTVTNHNYIPYCAITGGTITANTSLYGQIKLLKNLTVNSGVTLTIQPGSNLYIPNGDSITVNGTLTVAGTSANPVTFNLSGTGTWGTILFNGSGSSGSSLNYVTINNGAGIKCLNGANPTIQNSTIQNCTRGVYVYNSSPSILSNQILNPTQDGIDIDGPSSSPTITSNLIKKTTGKSGQGIYATNNGTPYIAKNKIGGWYYGMYIGGGCFARFHISSESSPYVNNLIYGNYYGLCAAWSGIIYGGYYLGANNLTDYNSIYGNTTYDAISYHGGKLYAQIDYWGSSPSRSVSDSSILDYTGSLSSDPWGGVTPSIVPKNNSKSANAVASVPIVTPSISDGSDIDISTGLNLEENGNIDGAITQYQSLIDKNNSNADLAITELFKIMKQHSRNDVLTYFGNFTSSNKHYPLVSKLIADNNLQTGQFDKAISTYDNLIKSYPNDYYGINARFEKLFAYINVKNDNTTAQKILSDIQALGLSAKDPQWISQIQLAESLLGNSITPSEDRQASDSTISETNSTSKYALADNYPNPFNPSTMISYQLPKDGVVTIKIYDALGREVKTLVNEFKTQGKYSVSFDASRLASGIYFYQLRAGNYISTKKMLLLK